MNRIELTERYHRRQRASQTALYALHGGTPYKKVVRYMEASVSPAVCWQEPKEGALPSMRHLGYVDITENAGLRLVGRVEAESYGSRDRTWCTRDTCGWYTDPDGFTDKDGYGLCWGVVYQLPTRHGIMRFVAGYQFGGCDNGPTLDLGHVYECPSDGHTSPPIGEAGALEASKRADDMARSAAEEERWFQEAQREEEDEDEEEAA